MKTFFCSDNSRQAGENVIGTASNYQTYILIECPPPWVSETFHSRWVPRNLQVLVEEVKKAKLPIKFLLIANNLSHKVNQKTLLIYQQQAGFGYGYSKQEFQLANIEEAAEVVRKWLSKGRLDYKIDTSFTRDILVCTHGNHDKCCARYGSPFYFQASATVAKWNLEHVRLWKSTHFGGHRFAPTAIDLPEGRYYGKLEQDSFESILNRTGHIECLNKVYRGWGILPNSIQALEREFILNCGWDWFNYKVTGNILEESVDKSIIVAELTCEKPDGSLEHYRAQLVKDASKMVRLRTSCNATHESACPQYSVENIWQVAQKVVTCRA